VTSTRESHPSGRADRESRPSSISFRASSIAVAGRVTLDGRDLREYPAGECPSRDCSRRVITHRPERFDLVDDS
jgi:hypothetical protein